MTSKLLKVYPKLWETRRHEKNHMSSDNEGIILDSLRFQAWWTVQWKMRNFGEKGEQRRSWEGLPERLANTQTVQPDWLCLLLLILRLSRLICFQVSKSSRSLMKLITNPWSLLGVLCLWFNSTWNGEVLKGEMSGKLKRILFPLLFCHGWLSPWLWHSLLQIVNLYLVD